MDLNRLNHTAHDGAKPAYTPPQVTTQDVTTLLQRLGPARAFTNNRSSGNSLLDDLLKSEE